MGWGKIGSFGAKPWECTVREERKAGSPAED